MIQMVENLVTIHVLVHFQMPNIFVRSKTQCDRTFEKNANDSKCEKRIDWEPRGAQYTFKSENINDEEK